MSVINLFNKTHNPQSNEEIAKKRQKVANYQKAQTSGKNYSSCISAITLRRGRFILPDFLRASARIN